MVGPVPAPCDTRHVDAGADLIRRLRAGEILILDGGVGTELQRRGVAMDSVAWCAIADRADREILRGVHADYIEAGADIITANTFSTARHVLEGAGLGDMTEEVNRAAVEIARQAADTADRPVVVAGSMSSMGPLDTESWAPTGDAVASSYREQAEILAAAGSDVLLLEMLVDRANASLIVEAASSTGLPLLLGWSASKDSAGGVGRYAGEVPREDDGWSFDRLMEWGATLDGAAAGIMHSESEVVVPALAVLRRHWSGPLMAYAETGRFIPPNWVFTEDCPPEDYAAVARQWAADAGVQIVGGCCGTTPAHIQAVSTALRS